MYRKFFASAAAVLLLSGGVALAMPETKPMDPKPMEKPMEKTDEKKVTTPDGTMKSKDHTVVGTVKEYAAGKKIKVLVGKKTRTFSLDAKSVTTTVDPSVVVGGKVKVVESKDANGNKTLTIASAN